MVAFDPRTQVFSLLGPDGVTEIPVSVPQVDTIFMLGTSAQVNYGSQIGATFVMLLVVLTMTPKKRFRRVPTLVNITALVINLIRCVLLSLYFTSTWVEFYTIMAHDISGVAQRDFNISVVATAFNIPIVILVEWALALQAWSMIQLWSPVCKWGSVTISAVLVVATVGFKFATVVLQCLGVVSNLDLANFVWVRKTDLVLSITSISWFCFLFVVRLLMHMWMHRTVLPPVKGLSAMEVLVMTNGILMLVPGSLPPTSSPRGLSHFQLYLASSISDQHADFLNLQSPSRVSSLATLPTSSPAH
jgi:pheromone alpha factor receptor